MSGFQQPPFKKAKKHKITNMNANSSHSPIHLNPSANGHAKMKENYFPHSNTYKHKNGSNGSQQQQQQYNRHPDTLRELLTQRHSLPIFPARMKILEELKKHQTVIIIGETGSGKTTQIPQYLHEERLDRKGGICVTQPRRVAAISIAKRVAQEMDTNLGGLVGYSVRFEEALCPATKLKYVTDGMLLREAISDPSLSHYNWVVLDEAHERTVNTDILFGIVKEAQKTRKSTPGQEPLKLIIMSATMDVDHFSSYFGNCPVLYVEGRQHPIELFYTKKSLDDYVTTVMTTLFQIHREAPPQHDVLVFLTGQEEIDSVAANLRKIAKDPSLAELPRLRVLSLYAALPAHQQLDVFRPTAPGERKAIISTNIAETSVTIPGIRYVVDCGRAKVRTYHPGSGFEALKVQKISQAQAWQRAGRAGREAPGNCYRGYTRAEFDAMAVNPTPEILRSNLASVILQLLAIGVKNVLTFDFMDKPKASHIESAVAQLTFLGAVETKAEGLELTETGRRMAQFPLEPRYAKVILSGPEHGCTDEVLTIISGLSSESIYHNPTGKQEAVANARRKFTSVEGDHITLLKVFRAFKASKKNKMWCHENFLNFRNLMYGLEVRKQLVQVCERTGVAITSCQQKTDSVRRCLATGLFTNAAELQLDGKYLTLDTKQEAALHPSSALFGGKPAYILFTELIHTGKTYMHLNSIVDPHWLYEIAPEYFRKKHIKM